MDVLIKGSTGVQMAKNVARALG